jgi:hypothetical protein
MKVGELIDALRQLPDNADIAIMLEDGPTTDPEDWDDLEPGAVLDVAEAGVPIPGGFAIRAQLR